MIDLMEEKEVGGPITGDGAEQSKGKERSKLDGNGPTSAPKELADAPIKKKEGGQAPESTMTVPKKPDVNTTPSSIQATKPGKPAAEAKDTATSSPPSGSKDEVASSENGAVSKEAPNLGSILKGSAFEKEEGKNGATFQKPSATGVSKTTEKTAGVPKKPAVPGTTKPIQPSTAAEETANGKPKEPQAVDTKTQAKTPSEQSAATKTQTAPKAAPAASAKPVSKEPERKDGQAKAAPTAINTSNNKDKAKQSGAASRTPTSSTGAAAIKKETSPEKNQSKPSKEPVVAPKPSPTQTNHKAASRSEASKPSMRKPASSAASTATKLPPKNTNTPKSPPTSGVGFTKPKPRSPTRPVKLPAHLTAQTAASAAKHGNESHVEPHKDTPLTTTSRPLNPNPPQQRKPPRASMPAVAPKPMEKEKAKPRMSVAGGSTTGGSFLERMMRPTQSSAQKTHERTEPVKSSPPRKPSGSRNVSGAGPRTVTGASTHRPDEHAHNDGGHGQSREKHGGPTKSEVEHGEWQEAPGPKKENEAGVPAATSSSTAPKNEPASASEEPKMPSALGNTDEKPRDRVTPATEPSSGMQTF